jgi:GTP cyclohydrolase I
MNPKYDTVPENVANACKKWLDLIGYDMASEHTKTTFYRLSWYVMNVAKREKEVYIRSFPNEARLTDMVIVPNIHVWSACSHHLLPFFGTVDFGYVPGSKILGFSKIPEAIKAMSKGAWVQEELTRYIADRLQTECEAMGVIVRMKCIHTCMIFDLDDASISPTITSAIRGVFAYNPAAKEEFLAHLRG